MWGVGWDCCWYYVLLFISDKTKRELKEVGGGKGCMLPVTRYPSNTPIHIHRDNTIIPDIIQHIVYNTIYHSTDSMLNRWYAQQMVSSTRPT